MMPTAEIEIYEMQAEISGALAHPVRLRILDLLSHGEQATQALLTALDIPKANLSQHILVLRSAGLLEVRKDGRSHYVSLALPRITEACRIVRELLVERLAAQEHHAATLKANLQGALS